MMNTTQLNICRVERKFITSWWSVTTYRWGGLLWMVLLCWIIFLMIFLIFPLLGWITTRLAWQDLTRDYFLLHDGVSLSDFQAPHLPGFLPTSLVMPSQFGFVLFWFGFLILLSQTSQWWNDPAISLGPQFYPYFPPW